MKTLKLLALVAVLGLASIASAQTLTRSLVLKPAGALGTLTVSTGALTLLETYSITLPTNGSSLQGPIVKTSTATGNKTWTFGQIDLTSNAATTGDITGTLGVGNGGTGVASIAAGGILLGSGGTAAMTVLAPGANTSVLTMSGGTPTWSDLDNLNTTAGAAPVTNINVTDNNAGSGTESVTNIGYNVPAVDADDEPSTTNINGNTNIGSATGDDGGPTTTTISGNVVLPLATNNVWTGVANVATALPPTASSIFVTAGAGNLVPQWSTTLPSGLTIPGATITTPTITGGTINNTIIGGTTPAAGTFTTLTSVGTTNLNNTGTGTTNIGNNAGPSVTNIAGDVNFTASTPVNFSVMPELPLTLNRMYVGNASNYATELPTVTDRILTSPLGVPTWSNSLPTGVNVPFNQISSGTNTTAVMVVDGTATLAPAGTGSITANRFVATGSTSNAVDLATAEVNGTLPIANGGTNSTTIGGAGTVSYSTGTAYASTVVGASGQLLQSNGAGAPTWVGVGNLLAAASAVYVVTAADEIAGFAVVTPAGALGYDASSRVIITLETASGPAQAAHISTRTATTFRVYTGAIAAGDIINYIIIDTTP